MTDELKKEYTLRITGANSSELVVILYEMLDIYLDEARENLGKNDLDAFHESIRRCTGCVRELSSSVNFESDAANNLMSLYIYCMRELSMADLHHSAEELYHVELVMNKLHATFKEIAKNNHSKPVMENSQVVYAGLTYGKESLIVHLNGQAGRGYTV